MGFRASAPAQNTGYNRTTDWPVAGGVGLKVNGITAGIGGAVGLKSTVSAPGAGGGTTQWHPTVSWMLGFVVVELVLFHMLSKFMNL